MTAFLIDKILDGSTRIYSLGQAGYIIQSSHGSLLGIDLYLSDCVERTEGHVGFKRLLPRILDPYDVILDVLIATHFHLDHYDIDSVPALVGNKHTILYAPSDCKDYVANARLDSTRVYYVKAGEEYDNKDFHIRFVTCDHGTGAPLAVGVIIDVDGKRIYETGDTCLRLDTVNEILEKGNIDVLIGPINGAYGNMNEIDFCQLAKALKVQTIIPCHYGMFASHGGNPGLFLEVMQQEKLLDKVQLLRIGENLKI